MAIKYQFLECPEEYGLLPRSFGLDLRILQEACLADNSYSCQPTSTLANKRKVHIPFTARMNMIARVDDFNHEHHPGGSLRTLNDRLRFFHRGLNSCTYVAFSSEKDRFKIIPECLLLIEQPHLFDDPNSFPVVYDSEPFNEFKWEKDKYCRPLTRDKASRDPIWFELSQGDPTLLKEYVDIVVKAARKEELMGIYIYHPDPKADYRKMVRQSSVSLGSLAESGHAYSTQYSNRPYGGVFIKAKKV